MTFFLTIAAAAVSAVPESALLVSYQQLGVEPSTMAAIGTGFRDALSRPSLSVLPAAESEKALRAATMCGEDSVCLSSLGERAGARWVLAYGAGKVGASLLVTAVFVDAKAGKELGRASRRVPEGMGEWALLTKSVADEVVKLPVEPVVLQVPVEVVKPQKTHKFRPWAFVTLGVAAAFAVAATFLGVGALGNYNALKVSPADDRLRENQRALNNAADGCAIVSVLGGGLSLLFFVLDASEKPVVTQ